MERTWNVDGMEEKKREKERRKLKERLTGVHEQALAHAVLCFCIISGEEWIKMSYFNSLVLEQLRQQSRTYNARGVFDDT